MSGIANAINDFQRARRRADLEQIYARLTGRSTDLLSYEEVRKRVRATQQIERGLQDVPLDAIVGSAGRYKDFTRSFLPKDSIGEYRWAKVKAGNLGDGGLPPVDLYKIGEAYFVLDGNHRVSVAREMGLTFIQAYVTEVLSKVPVTPDMDMDDLIIAEQYASFLEKTQLDELRPEADLRLTAPGKYPLLIDHIEVHRFFMGKDLGRDIDWEEAVGHWYDQVYVPVIRHIRERGIMRDFPDRTETDLYVWLAEHRAELEESLGWQITTAEAVDTLVDESGALLTRMYDSMIEEAGRNWRDRPETAASQLFGEILVSVGESDASWHALEQAAIVATKEQAHIRGVHFTPTFKQHEHDHAVHEQFEAALAAHRVNGRLADGFGDWARIISDRARWSDLIVLGIQHPPDGTMLTRLTAEWRQILQYSPRPVLAVPRHPSPLAKALIAFDDSQRSWQAVYVGVYLAAHWGIPLVVIAIDEPQETAAQLAKVEAYVAEMGGGIDVEFLGVTGDVAANILVTLESHNCDFIIMGGYGANPLRELFSGSTIDHVLRSSWRPILICP